MTHEQARVFFHAFEHIDKGNRRGETRREEERREGPYLHVLCDVVCGVCGVCGVCAVSHTNAQVCDYSPSFPSPLNTSTKTGAAASSIANSSPASRASRRANCEL